MKSIHLLLVFFLGSLSFAHAVDGRIKGQVKSNGEAVEFAAVLLEKTSFGAVTDESGAFSIGDVPPGDYVMKISYVGYLSDSRKITVRSGETLTIEAELKEDASLLEEVVISGTMKEVTKLQSPVPVEVYSAKFFRANPSPTIFEALQNINGVKPQVNCSVCNTGDIHINGLEGPYTMVLIDGMPIVSGLSTVYGLSGIPQAMIERVEIVKGPASTLYGSEAVGGLINVITKRPSSAPIISLDAFGTSWGEANLDLAGKFKAGKKAYSLLGANYFNYQNPIDNNNDGFTDVTLQNRVSVFNKWNFDRKDNRLFSLAARYIYEDRWGGEMNWKKKHRGGDEVYGESIYTKRWEFFGTYQLPTKERFILQFSANGHDQNSAYGDMAYIANQYIGFGQLTWNKIVKRQEFLIGSTIRYTYYDDNTPATASSEGVDINQPMHTILPGLFVQDEITLNKNHTFLLGLRYDYNSIHGSILTPRFNYKWTSNNQNNVLRFGIGNGYRVANVFTEDHAALTGSRDVVFNNELKPETSWNANLNFVKKIYAGSTFIGLDASAFYTYFTNKIIPDYDTDPNKIIYDNLDGHAVSRGLSLNLDVVFPFGLKIIAGATAMDVYNSEEGEKTRQMFAERFTSTWNIGYTIKKIDLTIDYTGNLYGPMRLPLISDSDPRPEYSSWWSIQNIQITKKFKKGVEIYGGVKNLLNWTPNKGVPFVIARAFDPFDRGVEFDANGQAMVTPGNPYGLTFDPAYVYASNQGIRGFLGIRYNLFK